jgi:hypothetical protein
MPGLLQTETYFHSSTVIPVMLRKTKRMLTKTEKQGEIPHLYRSQCSKSMGKSHTGAPKPLKSES